MLSRVVVTNVSPLGIDRRGHLSQRVHGDEGFAAEVFHGDCLGDDRVWGQASEQGARGSILTTCIKP